ncbi:hypothetical protein CTI12_AA079010 [Artemisia annua]|uniref:Uncharacterized protein n=1 Tax=Artemisia annua TaxID=35608 RepID=A0A2U1Q3M5_ARTAN|nr:hypothetical protein CTI12_AA079010 [Artemisia annua]
MELWDHHLSEPNSSQCPSTSITVKYGFSEKPDSQSITDVNMNQILDLFPIVDCRMDPSWKVRVDPSKIIVRCGRRNESYQRHPDKPHKCKICHNNGHNVKKCPSSQLGSMIFLELIYALFYFYILILFIFMQPPTPAATAMNSATDDEDDDDNDKLPFTISSCRPFCLDKGVHVSFDGKANVYFLFDVMGKCKVDDKLKEIDEVVQVNSEHAFDTEKVV